MADDYHLGLSLIEQIQGDAHLAADEETRIAQLYRFITTYNLTKTLSRRGLTSLGGDIAWSLRIARRQGLRSGLLALRAMRLLRGAAFDTAFYRLQLQSNPRADMDPVRHYVVFGAQEGFDPAPGFDTAFYLSVHSDVAGIGMNPFAHFLKHGYKEKRRVEPSRRIVEFVQALRSAPPSADDEMGMAATLNGLLTPSIDDTTDFPWPKRDNPRSTPVKYDQRPDDPVIGAGRTGDQFLQAWKLLSARPDWAGAVAHLNQVAAAHDRTTVPDVSIVIPIYGQLAYTLNCLDSLLGHASKYSFEIIVGDDASPDESETWLKDVQGIVYRRYEANEGFIANCNKTARLGRGRFIVMLNNDTRICPGWLDALVDTFTDIPGTGLAGSKLFYPDGSLQEAGGIVWQDGSAWNYGRNDNPNRPRYCYARDADYISGASIALKRETWEALGGFDTHYAPAYYEDTDLAFRVRKAGLRVIMQPLSRIIHYEGKTSGTDTTSGAKAYQVTNARKFFERWSDVLANHRPNAEAPWLEKDRGKTKRVLIVDATTPTRFTDAGSIATLNLIEQYQTLGFKTLFVPEDNFLYQPEASGYLQATGTECLYAPYDLPMTAILRKYGAWLDVIHVIRPDVAARNIKLIRRFAPQAKLVYLNADLHFLRMERQAAVENKPELRTQATAMKEKELDLADAVDVSLVHSTAEKALLEQYTVKRPVVYYPLSEPAADAPADSAGRTDFMFLGGYNHTPNADAAQWIVEHIWPQLAQALPKARLLLVGANPPPALRALADDRIVVTGKVEDLTPLFATTRVFLAPLRYGAGAKGKVLTAMRYGVPVVATDIAAEGMPFEPGKNIHIANTAPEIVAEALRLYRLPKAGWERTAGHAQTYVADNHSLDAARQALSAALDLVLEP